LIGQLIENRAVSLLQTLKLPPVPTPGSSPATAKTAVAAQTAGTAPKSDKLLQAAEAWRQTRGQANERITALKAAVKGHCADAPSPLLQEIEKGLAKLDEVLDTVDDRLADSLATAGKATDESILNAELRNAKALLAEYIKYVTGVPLVAHIDQNPFGVKTGLQALLSAGLSKAAKVV
jgi:hypothetical protein